MQASDGEIRMGDKINSDEQTLLCSPQSVVARENAAMTSFKRPPSLKPMIPICIYVILSSAGPSMVFPILPRQRKEYFGSDSTAALWVGVCESISSVIGLFLGGLFGLAADAYGRKIILLISAFLALVPYPFLLAFDNPWPYMILSNLTSMVGSTPIGNAAVGFMVIADRFEKDCRLLPITLYIVALFVGVMTSPIPSALHMSDTAIAATSACLLPSMTWKTHSSPFDMSLRIGSSPPSHF
jgi:MFS family permease